MRTIIYGLLAHRILHTKTDYSDKDFSSTSTQKLETFLDRSFYYPYLMNVSGTVLQVTDLADLWYREFYLELSKRLQFPIEMSLPWILTDEILESKNSSMMEFMLFPLDLYNDAAARALHSLNQRFLYDEIEAEVNLCFDQLVFKISEQIYTYYKMQASRYKFVIFSPFFYYPFNITLLSILMDKPYRHILEAIQPNNRFHPPKSRYDVLLKQRLLSVPLPSLPLFIYYFFPANTELTNYINYPPAVGTFDRSQSVDSTKDEYQIETKYRFCYQPL